MSNSILSPRVTKLMPTPFLPNQLDNLRDGDSSEVDTRRPRPQLPHDDAPSVAFPTSCQWASPPCGRCSQRWHWVMAKVSYSSHRVFSFYSSFFTLSLNCLIPALRACGYLKSLRRYVSIEHPSLNFLWKKLENIIDLHKVKTWMSFFLTDLNEFSLCKRI
jgi:hypothetical protein